MYLWRLDILYQWSVRCGYQSVHILVSMHYCYPNSHNTCVRTFKNSVLSLANRISHTTLNLLFQGLYCVYLIQINCTMNKMHNYLINIMIQCKLRKTIWLASRAYTNTKCNFAQSQIIFLVTLSKSITCMLFTRPLYFSVFYVQTKSPCISSCSYLDMQTLRQGFLRPMLTTNGHEDSVK